MLGQTLWYDCLVTTPAASAAKLSKNHLLVHDIVQEQGVGRHLTMADVYELARAKRPGIGFTTVYRAITRLRDAGLVSEIVLAGADSAVYEPSGDPHAHFRCTACGSVSDVPYVVPDEVAADLGARLGVQVSGMHLSLHGKCASCRD